ncbi:MAG: FAD-linked oxidase C-terminal domain-containing protein, partial [Verrucomicrobiota bacterium]
MSVQVDAAFQTELERAVKGDVFFDDWTRGIYSTDASNYQIRPVAVVCPEDEEDVAAAVALAARYKVSILPRGGGTSLAGQTVGESMVLDFSKHMNRVLELNVEEGWVRVQPGLVRDELNARLAEHRLQLAPDPATANRANIGGMIGNNSSGTRSIVYGKTIDHTLELNILLADGTRLECRPWTREEYRAIQEKEDREAELYGQIGQLIDRHRDEIRSRFPKVMRRVGGYNLDELVDAEIPDLTKLVVGSEGTLAVLLEAKMKLVPVPRHTGLIVPHFKELRDAIQAVPLIVEQGPSAVEILDRTLLEQARMNAEAARYCTFLEGDPAAVLMVELTGDSAEEVKDKTEALDRLLKDKAMGYAAPIRLDPAGKTDVWEVRKRGLGLLLGVKTDRKPLPFIEDASVPVDVLPEYIDGVLDICKQHEIEVAMYAHASVGLIHVRPLLDLRHKEDIEAYRSIAEQTFKLVCRYEGSWSGEHGDGLVRSPFMERFFGETLYGAFKQVKQFFDPDGLMNPGKIVGAPPMTENLRYGEAYRTPDLETVYRYREDGSFANAVHLCSGVGACRKTGRGTMCPSYMGTRDERHTTRGRANALRLAMSGQLGADGMTDRR